MSQIFTEALLEKAQQYGIHHLSVTDIDLTEAGEHLNAWLEAGFHGTLDYMAKHGEKRYRPELLVPDTCSILTCQLDYYNPDMAPLEKLNDPQAAYISMYSLGRDYHKVLRNSLNRLGRWLQEQIPDLQFRAFVDSAPVMERALNEKSGLGFIGKNTMLIDPNRGSFFFLGQLYLNKTIPFSRPPITNHCGRCQRCIDICPTQAIVAPFRIDARRCISYLTIELFGPIPKEFRRAIGNRIFGCDDCQLVCPWNRFAQRHEIPDFEPRNNFHQTTLLTLFSWSEEQFLQRTAGMPIRRLGYERWMRNIAVALGNDQFRSENVAALKARLGMISPLVDEHIHWALDEQALKAQQGDVNSHLRKTSS